MTKYVGHPDNKEWGHRGDVFRVGKDSQQLLAPRNDLVNHSPDGFSWGYGGSGPAQLALAILADVTRDDQVALKYYQKYKFDKIARLPRAPWEIDAADVREWIEIEQTFARAQLTQ